MIAGAADLDELLARRTECGAAFFEAEAARVARLCRDMAERFLAGGRLLAAGRSPAARSDARHVAVEFVHPVIVGKRALPALCVDDERAAGLLASGEDMVAVFEADGGATIAGERFDPPSEDPFVRQELVETLYHVLWELVHVFFEHRGRHEAGGGASSFLYPFLEAAPPPTPGTAGDEDVLEDVRRSVLMKAHETAELRAQTLRDGAEALLAFASLAAEGTVLALGNGGSATDAMDLVADLQAVGRRAIDLSADPSIITAVANDVGVEAIFARQVIAYGRPRDGVVAISTSGGSENVIAALAEARRRGLATLALVGYDGGRIAAEGLADHVVVTRSQHIPRIQEAQATAYHALVELMGRR
jgi:D-sedoheptulose 7-phosphate isomerase